MKVIVMVKGREAIPVRAIPLLTDWKKMSPDFVARVFAGDEDLFFHLPAFEFLSAYQFNSDGSYSATEKRAWESWVVRGLDACSRRLKDTQSSHETGYQQWRQESWKLLPAGVFVWRDEFERAYQREYGLDSMRAQVNSETYEAKAYELNFNPEPWGLSEDWRSVVMDGFVTSPLDGQKSAVVSECTDVAAANAQEVASEWMLKAQSLAWQYIKNRQKLDCYPSQEDVADHVANEFRTMGIVGKSGKPLMGSYIKRHALKGISSARKRRLSISRAQGK